MFPNEVITNACKKFYLYFPCRHYHHLLVPMVFPSIIRWPCKYEKVSCLETHFGQDVRTRELIGNSICWNCNPNLRLAAKARAYKGASQEWSLGITFHATESVGECERMNLNTPKWAPTLEVEVPMDSRFFKEQLQRSKLIGLKSSSYHWKSLGM
jgi:hypothetical protein